MATRPGVGGATASGAATRQPRSGSEAAGGSAPACALTGTKPPLPPERGARSETTAAARDGCRAAARGRRRGARQVPRQSPPQPSPSPPQRHRQDGCRPALPERGVDVAATHCRRGYPRRNARRLPHDHYRHGCRRQGHRQRQPRAPPPGPSPRPWSPRPPAWMSLAGRAGRASPRPRQREGSDVDVEDPRLLPSAVALGRRQASPPPPPCRDSRRPPAGEPPPAPPRPRPSSADRRRRPTQQPAARSTRLSRRPLCLGVGGHLCVVCGLWLSCLPDYMLRIPT